MFVYLVIGEENNLAIFDSEEKAYDYIKELKKQSFYKNWGFQIDEYELNKG